MNVLCSVKFASLRNKAVININNGVQMTLVGESKPASNKQD